MFYDECNAVKLSKYLKMFDNKDKSNKTDCGQRELKKLEWDMKDASVGETKRNGRLGSSKVSR